MAIIPLHESDLQDQKLAAQALAAYWCDQGFVPSYSLRTYGCQLNASDSEKIAGMLTDCGYINTADDQADLLIFNTCSIRKNASDRLFGNLGHAKALKSTKPSMLIAVCGCMMKQEEHVKRIRSQYPYVDLIFGPQDIHKMPLLLKQTLLGKTPIVDVSEDDYLVDDTDLPITRQRRFRALVPIMFGCNNYCTYCVVPYTRGRERSRSFDKILQHINSLSQQGYKEIMLLGQNVNSYGNDLLGKPGFADLLLAASKISGLTRLRFMTSHPKDLSHRIIDIMANNDVIERHLHLPAQSGSNQILKAMNRGYTREMYLDICRYFRKMLPKATISTDLIVGFPGENQKDFDDTLSLMEDVRFDSAYTFQYSPRPGTRAEKMPNHLSQEVITKRFSQLVDLQNAHSMASNQSVLHCVETVLIEGQSQTQPNILTGRTSSNRLVNFTIPEGTLMPDGSLLSDSKMVNGDAYEGKMADINIDVAKTFSLFGRLERFIDGRK